MGSEEGLGSCFYYDVMYYVDGLLEQFGLGSHRRGEGWLADLMDPEDLKGLVDEYKWRYER